MLLSIVAALCASFPSKTEFPIAVWLQEPAMAGKYQAAGFNLYVGLWEGPTERQLSDLRNAHMQVVCEQNAVGLAHIADSTIYGWMHQDEPDNAQALPNGAGYGPCVPPEKIVQGYRAMRAKDPSRPVMLNLGQGVANDQWIGRGNGSSLKDYETYVKGADIVSFDVYPVAGLGDAGKIGLVAKGLDRLASWTSGKGRIWNCVECTNIGGIGQPTPDQVRAEAWLSIIHGSRGLIYFVHQFKPKFDEHALLDDPEMLGAVTRLNHEIQALNFMIQSTKVADIKDKDVGRLEVMARTVGKTTYVVAVNITSAAVRSAIRGLTGSSAEVLSEGRTLALERGSLEDDFAPFATHIYKIESQ